MMYTTNNHGDNVLQPSCELDASRDHVRFLIPSGVTRVLTGISKRQIQPTNFNLSIDFEVVRGYLLPSHGMEGLRYSSGWRGVRNRCVRVSSRAQLEELLGLTDHSVDLRGQKWISGCPELLELLRHSVVAAQCELESAEPLRFVQHHLNLEDNRLRSCSGLGVRDTLYVGGNPLQNLEVNCARVSVTKKKRGEQFYFDHRLGAESSESTSSGFPVLRSE